MKARYLIALTLCLLPVLANAHPGHDGHSMFAGMAHPWLGMDHLIVMLAVGMWASQLGGGMRWALPLSFVTMMIVGAAMGLGGIQLGAVEQSIAASVCVLGLFLSTAIRFPTVVCILLTSCFALFHGYAHAAEAGGNSALLYIGGFAVSTALLHGLGLGIGRLLSQHQRVIRWVGAAIAISGVAMFAM